MKNVRNVFGATLSALLLGCAISPDGESGVSKAGRPVRRAPSPSCLASNMPYKIGVARYTMCERTIDEALGILQDIDCHYMGLMEDGIGYDATDAEIAAYKAKCAVAGVKVVSAGPLYFSTEEQLRKCCEFAKRYGMKYISVVPFKWHPKVANITDRDERAKVLAPSEWRHESDKMMDVLEKCVKEYDLRAAVHNHGPDAPWLYPTAEAALKRIGNRDRRIGVCLDVGHERRAGLDPVAFIRNHSDRIVEVHLKNIKIDPVENYAKEAPRGELDIYGILKALKEANFGGYCLIEYEKDFELNAMPLAESFGYYRGIMDAVSRSSDQECSRLR